MISNSRRHRDTAAETGQTMVEFVIVAPVLLMLLFGVIQFGIVFNNYLMVTDAARIGARKAAVSRLATTPVALTEATVRAAAPDLDENKLEVDVDAPPGAWTHGADVTVTASYPYEVRLLGFVIANGRVASSTTERIE